MLKQTRAIRSSRRAQSYGLYRRLFEIAKVRPPTLPTLREWRDEALGGALAPASPATAAKDQLTEAALPVKVTKSETSRKLSAETSRLASTKPKPEILPDRAPIVVQRAKGPGQAKPRKALILGAEPTVLSGDSCNVRDVLEASASAQTDDFERVAGITSELRDRGVRLAAQAFR